jgi:hypothetical protein
MGFPLEGCNNIGENWNLDGKFTKPLNLVSALFGGRGLRC